MTSNFTFWKQKEEQLEKYSSDRNRGASWSPSVAAKAMKNFDLRGSNEFEQLSPSKKKKKKKTAEPTNEQVEKILSKAKTQVLQEHKESQTKNSDNYHEKGLQSSTSKEDLAGIDNAESNVTNLSAISQDFAASASSSEHKDSTSASKDSASHSGEMIPNDPTKGAKLKKKSSSKKVSPSRKLKDSVEEKYQPVSKNGEENESKEENRESSSTDEKPTKLKRSKSSSRPRGITRSQSLKDLLLNYENNEKDLYNTQKVLVEKLNQEISHRVCIQQDMDELKEYYNKKISDMESLFEGRVEQQNKKIFELDASVTALVTVLSNVQMQQQEKEQTKKTLNRTKNRKSFMEELTYNAKSGASVKKKASLDEFTRTSSDDAKLQLSSSLKAEEFTAKSAEEESEKSDDLNSDKSNSPTQEETTKTSEPGKPKAGLTMGAVIQSTKSKPRSSRSHTVQAAEVSSLVKLETDRTNRARAGTGSEDDSTTAKGDGSQDSSETPTTEEQKQKTADFKNQFDQTYGYSNYATLRRGQLERLQQRREAREAQEQEQKAEKDAKKEAKKNIARNYGTLGRFFKNRPTKKDLEDRNIIVASESDNVSNKAEKQEKKENLSNFLRGRQTYDELVHQGVLVEDSGYGQLVIPQYLEAAFLYVLDKGKDYSSEGLLFLEPRVNNREVEDLVSHISKSGTIDKSLFGSPVSVTSLIKRYYIDLRNPLLDDISKYLLYTYIEMDFKEDDTFLISLLRSLIFHLPNRNKTLFQMMLNCFWNVCQSSFHKNQSKLVDFNDLSKEMAPILMSAFSAKPQKITKQHGSLELLVEKKNLLESVTEKVNFDINSNLAQEDSRQNMLKFLIQNYPKLFEVKPEDGISFVMKDGIEVVATAKFDKLYEKLLDFYYKESDFEDIFLLTHSYFIDPLDLLKRFISTFNDYLKEDVKDWQIKIRTKIFKLITKWLESSALQKSLNLIKHLTSFITESLNSKFIRKEEKQLLNFLKTSLKFHKKTERDLEKMQTKNKTKDRKERNLPAKEIPALSENFDWISENPDDVAIQMTLVDQELFQAISPMEFLKSNFTKPEKSPNFSHMAEKFNDWGLWVCTVIVEQETVELRTKAIIWFIKLSKCCSKRKNFNASYAIIAALNNSSISRLKSSWEKLPKKAVANYERLEYLFDMSKNHKNYRTELQALEPPLIPILSVYPKDLISLEEGNPNLLQDGQINFQKMRLIKKLVSEIQSYQKDPFTWEQSPQIYNIFSNLSPNLKKEDEVYRLSLQWEPRVSKK